MQEHNNNNYELYRLKDITPVGGITYYNNWSFYKDVNGYRFVVLSNTLKRYDKDWTNETTIIPQFATEIGIITDIYFYKGFYYVCFHQNSLTLYDNDFNYIQSFPSATPTTLRRHKIFKYKNKWFTIDTNFFKIEMYDEDANGFLDANSPVLFTDSIDFGGQWVSDYTAIFGSNAPDFSFNIVINYSNGELLLPTFNYAGTNSWINRFNLDNLINQSGNYFISKHSNLLNQIPYQQRYTPFIIDGHYLIFEKKHPFAHIRTGYWILDFDFNIVAKIKKTETPSFVVYQSNYKDVNCLIENVLIVNGFIKKYQIL